jgi:hypothetical protein
MTFNEIEEEMVLVSSSFKFNPYIVWITVKDDSHIKYKMVNFENGAEVQFGSLGKDDWDNFMGKALVLSSTLDEPKRRLVVETVLP